MSLSIAHLPPPPMLAFFAPSLHHWQVGSITPIVEGTIRFLPDQCLRTASRLSPVAESSRRPLPGAAAAAGKHQLVEFDSI